MIIREELLKGLTEDQIKKVKDFDDPRDLLALAKDEGVELTEEQLDAVSGGTCDEKPRCPMCNSSNVKDVTPYQGEDTAPNVYMCKDCHHQFTK